MLSDQLKFKSDGINSFFFLKTKRKVIFFLSSIADWKAELVLAVLVIQSL